jgi:2-C-methyl-D-erythritol 4-phosphate cytidylyltransferase / 2-C-methyl-D-erythritol 2,4-cyclodiphosphate synthase
MMAARVVAVVVAGGRGARAGREIPKQYRMIAGVPVIRSSLALFAGHAQVDAVQPVIHSDDADLFAAASAGLDVLPPVSGRETRQGSVRSGLEAVAPLNPGIILVHDAARPFASPALVARAIAAAAESAAAVPAMPVSDTVKQVDDTGRVAATLDRSRLVTVQTPQAFAFPPLLDAHRRAAAAGRDDFTDDAALAEWAGMAVAVFAGERANVKLTTADDVARAEAERLLDVRTGSGFDVHAFGEGDHVMLGGVRVPHTGGVIGHSDADVALHALTDAVLGALADGDIGWHFPPSDPQWRGVSSDRFLGFACERVRARGGLIAHLDVTIVCEAPRIGPHRDAMRARVAEIAGIAVERVAVKATTSETLGFTGRREGLVAMATATIRLPWSSA